MAISLTTFCLFSGIVLAGCTLFKGMSNRVGIPTLLAFIFLGMLFGSDGILKIPFDDYALSLIHI